MSWFDDLKTPRIKAGITKGAPVPATERTSKVPEGLWVKCSSCGEILQSKVLKENLQVCPECSHHFRMTAAERIGLLTDEGTFEEYVEDLMSSDPLQFDDTKPYKARLKSAAASTGLKDAFIAGKGKLGGLSYHLGVFEFKFMGGSMGSVVGEKITMVFEEAIKRETPAVVVSASGGARMQESILSLMQMAKTSAYVMEMRKAALPFISILTDPTTGGVAASFAMLGDIIIAEPNALIGFAGPRVIEQTVRQTLPDGFQRSEFLLEHGAIDMIIDRRQQRERIAALLSKLLYVG